MMPELFASLRLRLWLLVCLALIPALGLMIYTASEQGRHAAAAVEDQALMLVQLVSSDQGRLIEGSRQLLAAVARLPDVRASHLPECQILLASMLESNPLYLNFGVADRSGDIICSAIPLDEPASVADRAYFRGAIETHDFAVGDFQIGRVTRKATINFGYPVLDADGLVQGVLFAAMDLSWLNSLVADAELPEGALLVVIDRNGHILARYPNPEVWVGQSGIDDPLFQVMLAHGEGTAGLRGLDEIPRIYAFTGLRGLSGAGYVSIGIPLAVAYAPTRRVLVRNLALLILIGGIAFAAAWVGGNVFIVGPVRALVQATQRLSAGDLSARTGVPHAPGELGQLAAAFDDMAASLERHQMQQRREEELRRQNVVLEEQNRRAQELTELKNEFVSLVSHELRTPLTAMTGYLDLLLEEGAQDAAKRQEILGIVKRNADRLIQMVDGLLDLSHIESGTLQLRRTAVDVAGLISEVTDLLLPQIEAKGQQLTVDQADGLPPVMGDAESLRRIAINLLSNAHKYTPAGGRIWVTTRAADGWVHIDVRDNGIGLSPDEQGRLFDKFFRAKHPTAQVVAGTGLGLPITRSLVEIHGGQITVTSAAGQGATFSVILPAAHMPQQTMATE